MATQADVRRIALSLSGTVESDRDFAFEVMHKGKLRGYCWVWKERVDPKKARVPQPKVLAVRVANLMDKDILLQADTVKFFTEPHYNGYPAILVRLAAIPVRELRPLLQDAWRTMAPPEPAPKKKPVRSRRKT